MNDAFCSSFNVKTPISSPAGNQSSHAQHQMRSMEQPKKRRKLDNKARDVLQGSAYNTSNDATTRTKREAWFEHNQRKYGYRDQDVSQGIKVDMNDKSIQGSIHAMKPIGGITQNSTSYDEYIGQWRSKQHPNSNYHCSNEHLLEMFTGDNAAYSDTKLKKIDKEFNLALVNFNGDFPRAIEAIIRRNENGAYDDKEDEMDGKNQENKSVNASYHPRAHQVSFSTATHPQQQYNQQFNQLQFYPQQLNQSWDPQFAALQKEQARLSAKLLAYRMGFQSMSTKPPQYQMKQKLIQDSKKKNDNQDKATIVHDDLFY